MNKLQILACLAQPQWQDAQAQALETYPMLTWLWTLQALANQTSLSEGQRSSLAARLARREILRQIDCPTLPLPRPGRVSHNPPVFVLPKVQAQMPDMFFPSQDEEPAGEEQPKNKKKRFKLPRIPILEDQDVLDIFNKTEQPPAKSETVETKDETEPEPLNLDTEAFLSSLAQKSKQIKEGKSAQNHSADQYLEDSLRENDEAISETLAELLAQQGQKSRAIKMYQALALKFPEKNRFFAERIENLKKS